MAKIKKLTKQEKEELKELLLKEKQRLLEELGMISFGRPPVGYQGAPGEIISQDDDITDSASELLEADKIVAVENNIQQILKEIEISLQKVKENTYGRCDRCGGEIEKLRLKAIPYATLCVKCKSKQEKQF